MFFAEAQLAADGVACFCSSPWQKLGVKRFTMALLDAFGLLAVEKAVHLCALFKAAGTSEAASVQDRGSIRQRALCFCKRTNAKKASRASLAAQRRWVHRPSSPTVVRNCSSKVLNV